MYSLKTGVRMGHQESKSWRRFSDIRYYEMGRLVRLWMFGELKWFFEVIQRCASYAEGAADTWLLGSQTGMCFSAWRKEGGWEFW